MSSVLTTILSGVDFSGSEWSWFGCNGLDWIIVKWSGVGTVRAIYFWVDTSNSCKGKKRKR